MNHELFSTIRATFNGQDTGPSPLPSISYLEQAIKTSLELFSGNAPGTLMEITRITMGRIHLAGEQGLLADVPPIERDVLENLRAYITRADTRIEDVAAVIAGTIFETRRIQDHFNKSRFPTKSTVIDGGVFAESSALVDTELASYATWMTWADSRAAEARQIDSALQRLRDEANGIFEPMKERVLEGSNAIIDLQQKQIDITESVESGRQSLADLQTNASEYIKEVSSKFSEVEKGVSSASAKLDAVEENLATNSARTLWASRATSSAWAYWISTILLVALLLGIPALVISQLEWTLETLRHISDASMAGLPAEPTATQLAVASLSRLVVIALPVALFIWLIRLVVRFNLRSLLLLDDAQQRQTMMDTYFHLIEKQGAVKEDRALMLAALFRPAPGHGADNVDPPAFTELLDKMPGK